MKLENGRKFGKYLYSYLKRKYPSWELIFNNVSFYSDDSLRIKIPSQNNAGFNKITSLYIRFKYYDDLPHDTLDGFIDEIQCTASFNDWISIPENIKKPLIQVIKNNKQLLQDETDGVYLSEDDSALHTNVFDYYDKCFFLYESSSDVDYKDLTYEDPSYFNKYVNSKIKSVKVDKEHIEKTFKEFVDTLQQYETEYQNELKVKLKKSFVKFLELLKQTIKKNGMGE